MMRWNNQGRYGPCIAGNDEDDDDDDGLHVRLSLWLGAARPRREMRRAALFEWRVASSLELLAVGVGWSGPVVSVLLRRLSKERLPVLLLLLLLLLLMLPLLVALLCLYAG